MTRSHALAMIMLCAGITMPLAAHAEFTSCTIRYETRAWSIFYKYIGGTGTIHCDNGQRARVSLRFHGGGLTFGFSDISGVARTSEVQGPEEILGVYGKMEGHAGFSKSAEAAVMTRGPVWISQAGTGNGFDLGFAFGALSIRRE